MLAALANVDIALALIAWVAIGLLYAKVLFGRAARRSTFDPQGREQLGFTRSPSEWQGEITHVRREAMESRVRAEMAARRARERRARAFRTDNERPASAATDRAA